MLISAIAFCKKKRTTGKENHAFCTAHSCVIQCLLMVFT